MNEQFYLIALLLLPYLSASIFTGMAVFGRPNGGLMILNIIFVSFSLLILILGSSALSRSDSEINLEVGGMFDYRLFISTKWWIYFIPISIMTVRITKCFRKIKRDNMNARNEKIKK